MTDENRAAWAEDVLAHDEDADVSDEAYDKAMGSAVNNALGRFHLIFDQIEALTPELKSLLISDLLVRLDNVLKSLTDNHENLPPEAAEAAGIARNVLHLAGYTQVDLHNTHEEWTSTGDKRVDAVWDTYMDTMQGLVVRASDLPEGVGERIARGTATAEDFAAVRKIVLEKTGLDPELLDLESIVAMSPQGTITSGGKMPKATEASSDDSGTGQYL